MKKSRLYILAILLVTMLFPAKSSAQGSVQLFINGRYIQGDVSPRIENSRTMVPLRLVSETLGYDVKWNKAERSIQIVQAGRTMDLTLNSKVAYVTEKGSRRQVVMDVKPQIINDRSLVPLRFISENFGEKVDWDRTNRTVIVGEGYVPPVDPNSIILDYRGKSFKLGIKKINGELLIPVNDFARAMGWTYAKAPNEYEAMVPLLTDTATGKKVWNDGSVLMCDNISFGGLDAAKDRQTSEVISKTIGGKDFVSLRHLAAALHLNISQAGNRISLIDNNEPTIYRMYYNPLLDDGESYGYVAAKVNYIQYKNNHYKIMPMNKTPEQYIRQGLTNSEMDSIGMFNFYMDLQKNIVEAYSQG